MKTYRKLTLSLSLLFLGALIGATQAQAFTPGYLQKKAEAPFQCKEYPALIPSARAVDAPDWSAPSAPGTIKFPIKPQITDLNVPFGAVNLPGGIWINNYDEMKGSSGLRDALEDAKRLKATGYTNYSQKSAISSRLSSRKARAISKTNSIKQETIKKDTQQINDDFNRQNNTLYSDYKTDVNNLENAANQKLNEDYQNTWGNDSANKARYDRAVADVNRINREQAQLQKEGQDIVRKNCDEQIKTDTLRDEDIAEINADLTAAKGLEKKKFDDVVLTVSTEEKAALQKGAAEHEDAVTLAQDTAASQIIEIIETKEGDKVTANNEARNQVIENTIAAEDAVSEARALADEANNTEKSTAEDLASELTLTAEESITSLREGISSRVEEIQLDFADRKAQAAEAHRGNMRAIRSRWGGKINENRTKANQARRILRKKAGANWSNGNRQQLLQDQRRASAQLAAALKGLRYAKTTRDKQFSKAKVNYKNQLAAISKQERQQKQVVQGPVEQEVQQIQTKLEADIALINQKRDTAIAETEAKFNAEKAKIENRTNQQNALILSDLATVIATLDRQKNQESAKVDRQAKLEVAKLDRNWKIDEGNIVSAADAQKRELENTYATAVATLDQGAAKEIKTLNRDTGTKLAELASKQESELKALKTKDSTLQEAGEEAQGTYGQDYATAVGNWKTAAGAIVTAARDKANEAYSNGDTGYKDKASTALADAKTAVGSAKETAERQRVTNRGTVSGVYSDGVKALAEAERIKPPKRP